VDVEHQVPQLPREAVGAPVQAPPEDEATADTSAERDHHAVVDALRGAVAMLGDDRHVGVVVDHHGQAQALAHQVLEPHVVDREVVRPNRHLLARVHQRGDSETDGFDVGRGAPDLLDGVDDDVQGLRAIGSAPGPVNPVVDHERVVDDPSEKLGAPCINSDNAPWRHGRTIYRGV
jgi:hypothetical protein